MSVTLSTTASEVLAAYSVTPSSFAVGAPVDVKNRYIGTWSRGFQIAAVVEAGYLIRRMSDGSILPDALCFDEVRPG
jgi:hypothetical protein